MTIVATTQASPADRALWTIGNAAPRHRASPRPTASHTAPTTHPPVRLRYRRQSSANAHPQVRRVLSAVVRGVSIMCRRYSPTPNSREAAGRCRRRYQPPRAGGAPRPAPTQPEPWDRSQRGTGNTAPTPHPPRSPEQPGPTPPAPSETPGWAGDPKARARSPSSRTAAAGPARGGTRCGRRRKRRQDPQRATNAQPATPTPRRSPGRPARSCRGRCPRQQQPAPQDGQEDESARARGGSQPCGPSCRTNGRDETPAPRFLLDEHPHDRGHDSQHERGHEHPSDDLLVHGQA